MDRTEEKTKKWVKTVSKLIVIIVFCLILPIISWSLFKQVIILQNEVRELKNKRIETDAIREEVKKISEYSSHEFNYTSIMCFSDSNKFLGFNLPLTGNNFIATIDGRMKVGIKGDEVDFSEKLDLNGNVVKVKIVVPHADILDNYPIPETLKIYDENDNIFNPVKPEDYNKLLVDAKTSEEQKVRESDILQRSDESIKHLLETHFKVVYGDEIEIEYTYMKNE